MTALVVMLLFLQAGFAPAPGGPMLVYELKGGKWPGVYERLEVDADGAVRYEVLSARRVAGTGRSIGRFALPASAERARKVREAVTGVHPSASPLPPGAVEASLTVDGAIVAAWKASEPPSVAVLLHATVAEAQAHPQRTLCLDLGADGRSLTLTAGGDAPVTLDATSDELRLDLRFAGDARQLLNAAEARNALGLAPSVLSIAPDHPRTLPPLALPAGRERLDAAVLVAPSNVGAPWTVSLTTK